MSRTLLQLVMSETVVRLCRCCEHCCRACTLCLHGQWVVFHSTPNCVLLTQVHDVTDARVSESQWIVRCWARFPHDCDAFTPNSIQYVFSQTHFLRSWRWRIFLCLCILAGVPRASHYKRTVIACIRPFWTDRSKQCSWFDFARWSRFLVSILF